MRSKSAEGIVSPTSRLRKSAWASERFSTIERHMGTSAHEVLCWLYEERLGGRRPSRQAVIERYERQWSSPGLEGSIVVKRGLAPEDYRDDGQRMVLGYFDGTFEDDDSDTPDTGDGDTPRET